MTSFYVTDDGFEPHLQIRHFSTSFSFVSLHVLPVVVINSCTFLCQSLAMGTPCYILSASVGSRPVEGVDKMPIDLSSWRAGIANVNHKIHYPIKAVSYGPLLSYTFPIIWLFCYVYFFLALSVITFPLSVGITPIFANAPVLGHLVSYVSFDNKMVVLDSLLINFATLTTYVQSFICLIGFLSGYVYFVVRDQVVSTVSFILHEIHHSRKKISNLFRFLLVFWVSLS